MAMSSEVEHVKPRCEVDIKAYALGEATAAERRSVEAHLPGCPACSAEFESLGVLRSALLSARDSMYDEAPPRRIAFVSDKVFEPTWWQRINWFQLLAPTALAAAAAFAVVRTQAPAPVAPVAQADANVEHRIAEAVAAQVDSAVKQAVAESESRADARAAQLVQATERRMRLEHNRTMNEAMAVVEANFDLLRKRQAQYLRASADRGLN
jgi:anti-sigma factor RsiW